MPRRGRHPSATVVAAALLALPLAAQGVDFERSVLPILQKHCVECHRTAHTDASGKQVRPKAGLALDTRAGILAGRRGKPVLVAGKPDESELHQVVSLPDDDEDRMPPKDKKAALSAREKDVLKQWIASAKDTASMFGSWEGSAPATAAAAGAKDGTKRAGAPANGSGAETFWTDLAKGLAPVDLSVLRELEGKAQFGPVAHDSPLLRVSFLGNEPATTDAVAAVLAAVAPNVAVLDLGRTKVTDASAKVLASMSRLVELDLRETSLGDETLRAVAALPQLRTLNLFATQAGDAAMDALVAATALESVHVWQSRVGAEAVTRLRAARPALRVVFAPDLPEPAEGEVGRGRRRN